MRNILKEKPTKQLSGRLSYTFDFLDNENFEQKKILNLGCGFGWFELNIAEKNIKKITGLEITEKDLITAKENINDDKIDFKIGSAIDIPFPADEFDTVVSWDVIEHIPKNSEEKMFKEIRRVLKNNGTFYLSTPYDSFISKILDPAWWLIGHRHYKKEKLNDFAVNTGFVIEKASIKGGLWQLLAGINMYISKWIFRRKPFFNKFMKKKQNKEYSKNNGFAHIFVKFRKI